MLGVTGRRPWRAPGGAQNKRNRSIFLMRQKKKSNRATTQERTSQSPARAVLPVRGAQHRIRSIHAAQHRCWECAT
jgi:hypothetical protein